MDALRAFFSGLWDTLTGRNGFAMAKQARVLVALVLVLVLASAAALVGSWVIGAASGPVDPRAPGIEAALGLKVIALRLQVGLGVEAAALLKAFLVFTVLDRTPLGKRLLHWSPGMDSDLTSAAKTLGAVVLFAALVLAFATTGARVLP
jgi:hypothetical protein